MNARHDGDIKKGSAAGFDFNKAHSGDSNRGILSRAQLNMVAGANANSAYESFNSHTFNTGHPTYGGQGGGFVGTQSNGLDLLSILRDNSCAVSIVAGALAGAPSLPNAIKGAVLGAFTGQCFSGGNGNGGGSGSNHVGIGTCTW